MRRGLVLPFPARQHLTRDDHAGLQRFAVASPDAQIDILIGRDRREIAVLAFAGRQLWITRDETGVQARDGSNGQLLGTDTCIGRLLATIHANLLPDGALPWSDSPSVSDGEPAWLARAGE
jgi:hypothetical protein